MFRSKRKTELELSLTAADIDMSTEISILLLKKMIEYGYSERTVDLEFFARGKSVGVVVGRKGLGGEVFARVAYANHGKERVWNLIIYAESDEEGKQAILYEENIRSESDLWNGLTH